MAVSKAQQKAVTKYDAKAYDKTLLRLPKGRLDTVKAHASARGESTNGFIGRAILEAMERDSGTAPEIAGKPAEMTPGAGVVSLPSDTPEAAQRVAEAAGGGIPDRVAAAESLFRIMGSLGDVDLDESRGSAWGSCTWPRTPWKMHSGPQNAQGKRWRTLWPVRYQSSRGGTIDRSRWVSIPHDGDRMTKGWFYGITSREGAVHIRGRAYLAG